jgi:hypothetical protein
MGDKIASKNVEKGADHRTMISPGQHFYLHEIDLSDHSGSNSVIYLRAELGFMIFSHSNALRRRKSARLYLGLNGHQSAGRRPIERFPTAIPLIGGSFFARIRR